MQAVFRRHILAGIWAALRRIIRYSILRATALFGSLLRLLFIHICLDNLRILLVRHNLVRFSCRLRVRLVHDLSILLHPGLHPELTLVNLQGHADYVEVEIRAGDLEDIVIVDHLLIEVTQPPVILALGDVDLSILYLVNLHHQLIVPLHPLRRTNLIRADIIPHKLVRVLVDRARQYLAIIVGRQEPALARRLVRTHPQPEHFGRIRIVIRAVVDFFDVFGVRIVAGTRAVVLRGAEDQVLINTLSLAFI